MGATSKHGWYLFLFIVGFTIGPAGLVYLGWLVALVGFAMMGAALAGFYSIKEPATSPQAKGNERRPMPSAVGAQAGKNY
jgi:hypothetical protein